MNETSTDFTTNSSSPSAHEMSAQAPEMPALETPKKHELSWKFIIIVGIILVLIRIFAAEPFLVYGSSMEPTFNTNDYIIVDELSYRLHAPERGDVIVLIPPYDKSRHFIKRLIGLPNETIDVKGQVVTITTASGKTMVLNEPYVKLPSDKTAHYKLSATQYFVMGDNREASYDSRSWGPLPADDITGKAFLRLWPLNQIGIGPGKETAY